MELLTHEIAYTYWEKAAALSYNGMQDTGERRALRVELQERCGLTELEAINIVNGFHANTYRVGYLIEEREGAQEPKKGRRKYERNKILGESRLWEKQKVL